MGPNSGGGGGSGWLFLLLLLFGQSAQGAALLSLLFPRQHVTTMTTTTIGQGRRGHQATTTSKRRRPLIRTNSPPTRWSRSITPTVTSNLAITRITSASPTFAQQDGVDFENIEDFAIEIQAVLTSTGMAFVPARTVILPNAAVFTGSEVTSPTSSLGSSKPHRLAIPATPSFTAGLPPMLALSALVPRMPAVTLPDTQIQIASPSSSVFSLGRAPAFGAELEVTTTTTTAALFSALGPQIGGSSPSTTSTDSTLSTTTTSTTTIVSSGTTTVIIDDPTTVTTTVTSTVLNTQSLLAIGGLIQRLILSLDNGNGHAWEYSSDMLTAQQLLTVVTDAQECPTVTVYQTVTVKAAAGVKAASTFSQSPPPDMIADILAQARPIHGVGGYYQQPTATLEAKEDEQASPTRTRKVLFSM